MKLPEKNIFACVILSAIFLTGWTHTSASLGNYLVNHSMSRLRLALISVLIVSLLVAASGIFLWRSSGLLSTVSPEKAPGEEEGRLPQETIAEGLSVPWALAFLPDESLIFTERSGNIKLVAKDSERPELLGTIDQVETAGEGGLLGLAVHPEYESNHQIYIYYTYREGGQLFNKVVQYKLENSNLVRDKVVLDKIPGSANHNGGRIKFGPDQLLYITTGDAQEPELAQDKSSLAGKILRVKDNGDIPKSNPFNNSPAYSLGHRNPQGLAWDSMNRLWETEHGSTAHDEINLIKAGGNYGWPIITGNERRPGLTPPVIQSGSDTWAPSGAAFLDGTLYFACLRGQALFTFKAKNPGQPKPSFTNEFGRLRDVVVGPDNFIYIATSNRDGRGRPVPSDDRIIKIDPSQIDVD